MMEKKKKIIGILLLALVWIAIVAYVVMFHKKYADIFKPIVIFGAFFCFNIKAKPQVTGLNRWLINGGLVLLFCAGMSDFMDGFSKFDNVPLLGGADPLHDIFEDQFGDTTGLILFAIGTFREIFKKEKGSLNK